MHLFLPGHKVFPAQLLSQFCKELTETSETSASMSDIPLNVLP